MKKFSITALLFVMFLIFAMSRNGAAQTESLPELEFLGEGPGTFETPLDNFIVKTAPFDFKFVVGPTYTARQGERVWGSRGTNQAPPAEWDVTEDIGQVRAGCVFSYIGVDDDIDDRINEFRLDGEVIETVTQGLVFSGSFVIPRDGDLTFVARDSVGGYYTPCGEGAEPTSTATNTPSPTPSNTPPPTPTETNTPGPSPTPSETPLPTETVTPGPSPTITETAPPTVETATPVPSPTVTATPSTVLPTETATARPTPTRRPRELSCVRINFDVGGQSAARGLYVVQETGGKVLATWYALDGWTDSGWIRDIDISFENVYVQVLYYHGPDAEPVNMKILNPAPGTSYGWMSWGVCHAIEVAWPDGMAKPAGAIVPAQEDPMPPASPTPVPSPTPESEGSSLGASLSG